MKKFVITLFVLFTLLNICLTAKPDDLIFKGGHTIKLADTLVVSTDSTIALSDMLLNWSPFLNNIAYNVLIYSKNEFFPDGGIKFSGLLGAVRFKEGKYTSEEFSSGKMDAQVLFTPNYNNYKARIDCEFFTPGTYFLVTSTKGLNSSSEYYEKYSYWIINVLKSTKNELAVSTIQLKSENNSSKDTPVNSTLIENKNQTNETPQTDFSGLSVKAGASFESRFFWRGLDLSKSPVIEPEMQIGYGAAKLKIRGIYGLSEKIQQGNSLVEYNRIDFGVSYFLATELCNLTIGINDYYMPFAGIKFFKFEDDGKGAHVPELNATASGIFELPIELFGSVNLYNDIDKSWYLEARYNQKIGEYILTGFAGGTKGPSKWYNTKTWAVINFGLSVEKSININESTAIPVSVSYYLNTYSEENCLVFKISF